MIEKEQIDMFFSIKKDLMELAKPFVEEAKKNEENPELELINISLRSQVGGNGGEVIYVVMKFNSNKWSWKNEPIFSIYEVTLGKFNKGEVKYML